MNNQGLLALAQLILPSEILSNFEVVRVEEEASLIRIYLDESVKAEYKENPEIESKGFCEAVTIRDFIDNSEISLELPNGIKMKFKGTGGCKAALSLLTKLCGTCFA